jgi:hypothetical protein
VNKERVKLAGKKPVSLIALKLIFVILLFTLTLPIPAQTASVEAEIKRVIRIINEDVFDINQDGLINCIDYAIFFCIFYPGSRIILNVNPRTRMNHLFNAVSDGRGGWITIEPQYHSRGFTMRDVWRNQYDPQYDRDMTVLYLQELLRSDMFRQPLSGEREQTRQRMIGLMRDRINGR